MEIVATHIGADFDAFASMFVAQRLHPGSKLFFPGSKEESLRRMLEAGLVVADELRQRQIDPRQVERVILCDIRQRDRIGVVAEWLERRSEIEVVVYDHHPDSETDLPFSGGRVDPNVGSTSTLMVEELRERGMDVSTSEATLLLMGIYEDTGCLSYPTTRPRDLEAAAWLVGRGGDLSQVRRFALQRLDLPHVEILHKMTRSLEVHRIQGHRVGTVALELGEHVEELAPLVSRCLEIFELALLFGVFGEDQRVTVIGRGSVEDFDLGGFLSEFAQGGGHATAAAATVKGKTALEVRERLLKRLGRALPPVARAGDLMIRSFLSVEAEESVEEAKSRLNRRRVNAAPVVSGGRVVGTVTRQGLDAAIGHGLQDRPVESVMSPEIAWASPEAPVPELVETMLESRARFVLVGTAAAGRPQGLVTRMDALRHLYQKLDEAGEPLARRLRGERRQKRPIGQLLRERLSPSLLQRIDHAAAISRQRKLRVYLVGGLVRDLLLGRENRDLDLVVEGDGLHFARLLAAAFDGRVREHPPFKTAVVIDAEGFHTDVATARSEYYREPAALPEIEDSPIRQDLYRRDFTINTLAIRLGPQDRPELIDFFGGQRDLEEGVLRVLHGLSFIDDPTRVLRAVRLEQRLGFTISPETRRLVEVAVREGVFARLSGARLREELVELLDDPATAVPGLERLAELAVLKVIHPSLALSSEMRESLRETVAAFDWYRLAGLTDPPAELWRLLLLALVADLPETDRKGLVERLSFAGLDRKVLRRGSREVESTRAILRRRPARPHEFAEALATLEGEELLLLVARAAEEERALVRRYLLEWRRLELSVRGADLVAQGHPSGPAIGLALRATWQARVDDRIGPEEELDFALGVLERQGAEPERERPGDR